jgi:hypothetical protein
MAKRKWSDASLAGALVLVAVGLALGAGVFGFFLGRDTGGSTAGSTIATTAVRHVAAGAHVFVSSPARVSRRAGGKAAFRRSCPR